MLASHIKAYIVFVTLKAGMAGIRGIRLDLAQYVAFKTSCIADEGQMLHKS